MTPRFERILSFVRLSTTTFRSSTFALLIGIDEYESPTISSLRGAVADALAFKAYLRSQGVPRDHISTLLNQDASRAAIIEGLQRLANDPRIQRGDAIIIFYAGHGSEADTPRGWGPNGKTQLILPYDVLGKSGQPPLPDCSLGALVDAIAEEKGDNITVISDSCYSASVTRSFDGPVKTVRSAPLPPTFRIPPNLDQDIRSSAATGRGFRTHVLVAACGPSDLAYESNGRGDFTSGLLRLFRDTDISNLRYRDIPMRVKVNSRQSPHLEGFNRERFVFSSSSPVPTDSFLLIYTPEEKNGQYRYIINGGTAHDLVAGDKFAIYSDMDSLEPIATSVVEKPGPFYSIMKLDGRPPQLGAHAIAVRVKEGGREASSHMRNKVNEMLSHQDNDQGLSSKVQVEICGPETLSPILRKSGLSTLQQGVRYAVKLTNNSDYNLYPVVQYLDPTTNLQDTLYEPPCSRSMLDVPLKTGGDSLVVEYSSGGSFLVLPPSAVGDVGFLKISLFTRPLDPFFDARSLRLAEYLPESFKGPWATIVMEVSDGASPVRLHLPRNGLQPIEGLAMIAQPAGLRMNLDDERASKPKYGQAKGVTLEHVDERPPTENPRQPCGRFKVMWGQAKSLFQSLRFSLPARRKRRV